MPMPTLCFLVRSSYAAEACPNVASLMVSQNKTCIKVSKSGKKLVLGKKNWHAVVACSEHKAVGNTCTSKVLQRVLASDVVTKGTLKIIWTNLIL